MAVAMALCVSSGVLLLGGVNPYFASPVVVLAVLLAICQVFAVAIGGFENQRVGLHTAGGVSFIAYALFRYNYSIPEYEAREELISILVAGLVYLVALRSFNNRQTRSIFVYGLMGFAILESMYAAWQAFSKATTVLFWERPEVYDGRGSGSYICPNHLAGFLEMALGLVVARAIFLRHESKSIDRATILKVVTVYGAVMIAGGLVVTLSRGGWVAGGVGLLALLCFGGGTSRSLVPRLAVVGAILACAGGFLWSVDSVRNYLLKTVDVDLDKQQVTVSDPSLGGRIYMWKGTLPIIRENPILGTGIGSWKWEFQKYHSPQIFSFPEYTHNDYLNLASDYGIIGVMLLLLVFAAFLNHAFQVVRTSQSSDERAFAIGAISAVISILVHSFFDFNLHILANSTLLAAIMGGVAAIPTRPASERSLVGGRVWRICFGLVMMSMVALLTCFYIPTLRGYHAYEKGNAAKAELAYTNALAHYEASVRIDPRFSKPLIRAGDILKDQAGWRLGVSKQKERRDLAMRAAEYYGRALILNPLHTDVWTRNAQAHAMAGDRTAAVASFLKAIEIAPVNAYAHFALGRFYNEQGEEQKALEYLQKANNLYYHTEPMFFMNAVEAEERIRSKLEGPK